MPPEEQKPKHAEGYRPDVTKACERALVTLMGAFATLAPTVRLVGGLAPRYITPEAPPHIPAHAGTSDVDVVFNLQVIAEGSGYAKLAHQLKSKGFERHVDNGVPHSWRWKIVVEDIVVFVEFLRDANGLEPGTVVSVDGEKLSALAIRYSEITHDWYIKRQVTAELVGGGVATVEIPVADAAAFVILKALSLNQRHEHKDAADLIHVLQYAGSVAHIANLFVEKIHSGRHAEALDAGLSALRQNFCHADLRVAMKLIGPVQYAQFHVAQEADPDEFEKRRRDAVSLVTTILQAIDARRTPKEPAIA